MSLLTPLAHLVRNRMQELLLSHEDLGRRLGYTNRSRAAGRVHALTNGQPLSDKSRLALWRLPAAIEVSADVVVQAVADTERLFTERERVAEDQRRHAQETEEAACRKRFPPHAVIQTEQTRPSQITFCGLMGGAGPRLIIPLDPSPSPISFIRQAVDALPRYTMPHSDGGRRVTFFGKALGVIINYSPDHALRCDLTGNPLEVLKKAYRVGEVSLSFGGAHLSPTTVSTVLSLRGGED